MATDETCPFIREWLRTYRFTPEQQSKFGSVIQLLNSTSRSNCNLTINESKNEACHERDCAKIWRSISAILDQHRHEMMEHENDKGQSCSQIPLFIHDFYTRDHFDLQKSITVADMQVLVSLLDSGKDKVFMLTPTPLRNGSKSCLPNFILIRDKGKTSGVAALYQLQTMYPEQFLPYFIRVYAVRTWNNQQYSLVEAMQQDLFEYQYNNPEMSYQVKSKILGELYKGLVLLCAHGLVYTDIKRENVGIKVDPHTGELVAKWIDLSSILEQKYVNDGDITTIFLDLGASRDLPADLLSEMGWAWACLILELITEVKFPIAYLRTHQTPHRYSNDHTKIDYLKKLYARQDPILLGWIQDVCRQAGIWGEHAWEFLKPRSMGRARFCTVK